MDNIITINKMVPEYLISIFLYTTYLIIFISAVIFYAGMPFETRNNGGYITAITLSGAAFIGFNLYFFYQLMKHLHRKKLVQTT